MKKIILFCICTLLIAQQYSCKTKTADASCAASATKFMSDGKWAEYKIYYSQRTFDTSLILKFNQVSENIYQRSKSYQSGTILQLDSTYVNQYYKTCANNLYINNIGFNMDNQIAADNYIIKAGRSVGTEWNFNYENLKYWAGCAAKNVYQIFPYDTIYVDKIYVKNSPASIACDTIYWNDTIGVVGFIGQGGGMGAVEGFALMNKNY